MKFEELSQADQQLVSTQFPEDLEKQAAAEVEFAQELYSVGFDKFASQSAEELEKWAEGEMAPPFAKKEEGEEPPAKEEKEEDKEEKKEEKKEELSKEEAKEASDRAAMIARGYIDGVMKLGQDNHGDPLMYLYPALREKIASRSGARAVGKIEAFLRSKIHGAGLKASKTKAKAQTAMRAAGAKAKSVGASEKKYRSGALEQALFGKGIGAKAKGIGKLSPYGLVPAAAGGAGYYAMKDKKKK